MTTRSGTFLLFAMAAVSLTVVVVFAFLKAVELQRNTAVAGIFPQMAREAALQGMRHAAEELVKDYRRETYACLDAPGRASLRASTLPLVIERNWGDAASERVLDQVDVAMEARITRPAWEERMYALGDNANLLYTRERDWFHVPGRGRWFEVGMRNRSSPTATTRPAAVPFPWDDGADADGSHGQDVEAGTLSADLQSPLVYDAAWKRIAVDGTAASARAARRNAHWRLRYAVVVRDLDGSLLMNPDPDIDWRAFTKADPRTYTDPKQAMVARSMHAVPSLASALLTFQPGLNTNSFGGVPDALEHVFIGRGHGNNIARSELPLDGSSVDVAPRSFPLMYRGSADVRDFGNTLYGFDGVTASEAGGEQLPLLSNDTYDSTATGLMQTGAQASFYSINRTANRLGTSNPTPLLMGTTPFGRGLSGTAGATSGPYEGWVPTPWKVNLLTAPPAVVRALLYAYLPSGVVDIPGGRFRDLFNETHSAAFSYLAPGGTVYPDYHVADTRPGASRYPGAEMINTGSALPAPGNRISDALGAAITVSTALPVRDPFTSTAVAWGGAMPATDSYWRDVVQAFSNAIAIAKRGHIREAWNKYENSNDTTDPTFLRTVNPATDDPDVVAEPMTRPTTTAEFDRLFLACLGVDMTRQGTVGNTAPYDRIGYVWSGVPFANPPWPDWADGRSGYLKAVKSTAYACETIRSLRLRSLDPITGPQSVAMERVLNDFRLSFFGSDPAYTPAFRPLDFNGDGYATCSAYNAGRTANPADPAGQDSVADAVTGAGEWSIADLQLAPASVQRITPFCISGCLYIGRNRFWEVMVRGEVYDNRLKRPVANATLHSVVVIDPDARLDSGVTGDQVATRLLFQRWLFDRYGALMARE